MASFSQAFLATLSAEAACQLSIASKMAEMRCAAWNGGLAW
jgi:hypothetical protein